MSAPGSGHAELVLAGGRIFTGTEVLDGGWVAASGGLVAEVGNGEPPDAAETVDLDGDWLTPGFVDVHVHGGFGGDFMSAVDAERRRVREQHLSHGTTAMVASTVSAAPEELHQAVRRLAGDAHAAPAAGERPAARLLGIHLEGPFLSERRRGAHDPAALRPPDLDEFDKLLAEASGKLRTMTLAPELPGALELIEAATAAGVCCCLGHTDADAAQVRAAVQAGARGLTHTFNGMSPLHHRRPGVVGMAMDLDALTCELILDLIHVDPVAARALLHAAGPQRVCLVTDAIAAAGMASGVYELGDQRVTVSEGRALVAGTDTLAGSTLTMAEAVANAVDVLGIDVPTAAAMAGIVPARLLAEPRLGRIAPAGPADLVRLGSAGRLKTVWLAGIEVEP